MAHVTLAPLRYHAVLLDIDGTLVDSNAAHAEAWSEAFARHGRHHAPASVRPLIGKGGDKIIHELAGLDADSAEGQAIADARAEIFRDRYLPTLEPTHGAEALIAWLLANGLRVVVATSARQDEMRALLAVCGATALAHDATTSDDADRSKPDPDIIHAALARAGARPGQAIMVGDTPYDIAAAGRAGVATVAMRSGGWDDASLHGALAIFDHPAHWLAHIHESPLYEAGAPPAAPVNRS